MIDETPQDDSTPVEAAQPTDTPGDDAAPESPNREAARYRIKLREAEAERDSLATRLANMQRSQIDAHITTMGVKPAAVWAAGAELPDLVGDDGVVDPEKIAQAVAKAKAELGIDTSKHRPPVGSLRSGAMAPQPPRNAWRDAFTPHSRRQEQ
jgi:glycine/D-amino acid oxidase-like deaminating enzyme